MIVVMGDICKDINYYGEVKRISPEAPIPIFSVQKKEEIWGMSGNVANNLKQAGDEVLLLTKNIFDYPVTIKSRYFANKHYLYRIDEDYTNSLSDWEKDYFLETLADLNDLEAIVFQDYNKGFFDKSFIEKIIETVRYAPGDYTYIIADGHKERSIEFYEGVDYLKLNEEEYHSLMRDKKTRPCPIIKTLGENGAVLERLGLRSICSCNKVNNVLDVTGAGDTFISWFTSELVRTGSEEQAMNIACKAASISVQHLGCYAPTPEEVYK